MKITVTVESRLAANKNAEWFLHFYKAALTLLVWHQNGISSLYDIMIHQEAVLHRGN